MHKEHRSRMKNRFLAEGIDSFEPHEILELLLYYSIPQKDTNELAHTLIDRFGKLSAVFDAPYDDLLSVPGVSEHTATLIKLIPALSRRYALEKNSKILLATSRSFSSIILFIITLFYFSSPFDLGMSSLW